MSYSLRDLPLPVKVVVTVFLLAVGTGYTSAMVQLHMQDAKSGKPMPTVDDVIRKYTGKVKYDPNAPPPAPISRLEALIMTDAPAISGQSMAAAFTTQDRAKGELKFANMIKSKTPEQVKEIEEHRKGEQQAFKLWINAKDEDRKAAYLRDRFVPPAGQMPAGFTPALKDGDAIKIKSLIEARCATCHSKGEEKEDILLDTYEALAKHMSVDAPAPVAGYVKVEEPVSTTKLTQSTHAHLLSFAMLFSLTGLIFAMSSYSTGLRCVLGPWVVVAVFADVSLWWLARLCSDWGPYFAMGIIFTGGAAGVGLFAQVILSLFNLYGPKGKIVIAGLLVTGGVIGGLVVVNVIEPGLRAKASASVAKVSDKNGTPPADKPVEANKGGPTAQGTKEDRLRPLVNELDRLLTLPVRGADGKLIPPESVTFDGQATGSMAPAFFDREKTFKTLINDAAAPQAAKDKLRGERQAELDALVAWVRGAEPARRSAYDTDGFDAPELAGKVTPDFVQGGKVKIKSLIDARCARCHGEGKPQEEYSLQTYEKISIYLKPLAPEAVAPPPGDAKPPAPPAPPAPAPPAPAPPAPKADPIPPAKED
jgi:hypothetical protein